MKTVIEMAEEADLYMDGSNTKQPLWVLTQEELKRFAELVRADERARMAEQPAQQEPETKDVVIANMGDPFIVKAYVTPQPAQQQEPVGTYGEIFESMRSLLRSGRQADQQIYMAMQCKPLYTSPPAQRKPLSVEEMFEAIRPLYSSDKAAWLAVNHSKDEYRAIEAAIKSRRTHEDRN